MRAKDAKTGEIYTYYRTASAPPVPALVLSTQTHVLIPTGSVRPALRLEVLAPGGAARATGKRGVPVAVLPAGDLTAEWALRLQSCVGEALTSIRLDGTLLRVQDAIGWAPPPGQRPYVSVAQWRLLGQPWHDHVDQIRADQARMQARLSAQRAERDRINTRLIAAAEAAGAALPAIDLIESDTLRVSKVWLAGILEESARHRELALGVQITRIV